MTKEEYKKEIENTLINLSDNNLKEVVAILRKVKWNIDLNKKVLEFERKVNSLSRSFQISGNATKETKSEKELSSELLSFIKEVKHFNNVHFYKRSSIKERSQFIGITLIRKDLGRLKYQNVPIGVYHNNICIGVFRNDQHKYESFDRDEIVIKAICLDINKNKDVKHLEELVLSYKFKKYNLDLSMPGHLTDIVNVQSFSSKGRIEFGLKTSSKIELYIKFKEL